MKNYSRHARRFATIAAAFLIWAVLPAALHAQAPSACSGDSSGYNGDKFAWNSSSVYCNYHDYIDVGSYTDLCTAIYTGLGQLTNSSLSPSYRSSGIIDARGVAPGSSGTISCTGNNPFPATPVQALANATILLPAGTVAMSNSWYLPPDTRLIGEGPNVTILQASGASGAIIYMGDAAASNSVNISSLPLCGGNCNGISIEHLGLDGKSVSGLDGIDNYFAQELNNVNDVTLMNIAGTGLKLVGGITVTLSNNSTEMEGANNSGPYTDISFTGSGTCLSIQGTNNTRAVNGLHCNGTSANPAILLDGSNTMLQNVYIDVNYTGTDGIAIGTRATAENDVLLNVSAPKVADAVDVYTTFTPADLTLMGISGGTTNAIYDRVTGSQIPATTTSNPSVALYILGEPLCSSTPCPNTSGSNVLGYSRFNGSGSAPAWFQGTGLPTSGGACNGIVANGSLYSVAPKDPGVSGATLWACIATKWSALSGNY
jgi:hypothetical protein